MTEPSAGLPVASDWYDLCAMDDAVLVTEPHVAPLLRANIWSIAGRDGNLVIDAGLGLVPLRPVLDLSMAKPTQLVATHAHRDHIGGAHEFDAVCAHRLEAAAIAAATDNLSLDVAKWPTGLVEKFEIKGYRCRCGMLSARPSASFLPEKAQLQPAAVTRILDEGDVIDLGDQAFEVLHLPGHSPGSIGLFEHRTGALYSGDAVYDGPLLDDIEGADIEDYARTMERLLRLPIISVRPGHGPCFGTTRLSQIAKSYLQRWSNADTRRLNPPGGSQ